MKSEDLTHQIHDVAVIGGGGAGQMAMLRAVLNNLDTLAYLGDATTRRKGRATWVTEVDNIPGMFDKKKPITAASKEVLAFIKDRSGLGDRLTTLKEAVRGLKKEGDVFVLSSDVGSRKARFVVLCTGTMDVQPQINGSIEPIFPYANRGDVLYCIRCDGHRTIGHRCAVIGSGGGAGWISIMLKERYALPGICVLSNGAAFSASEEVADLMKRYEIDLIEDPIDEILGSPKSGLSGFRMGQRSVEVTRAFVSLGSIVYNDLAKQVGAKLNHREHILTSEEYETSVSGLFAAGDLVADKKKQVYTAWDMAVDAVDTVDERIRMLRRSGKISN